MKIKVTQVRSKIGWLKDQKATLESFGLRKIGQSVVLENTPCNLGKVTKVRHLLKIENINE
jgi:large subunit ribosomal protein L30